MVSTDQITGIILAGGKSSRMGQDKGLMEYQGQKLIEYSIDVLRPVCDELLISANQPGYEGFGIPVVADHYEDCGPVGGLHASLRASKHEWNLVVGCDTPFLNKKLLYLLLSNKEGYKAVIPNHSKGMEPLAALYHRDMAAFFEQKIATGDLKLHRIVLEQKVKLLDVSDLLTEFPRLFENFNSPEDL